ncbi:HET-domain-containing protein [Xylaria sp. FL0064]|nr:HET-domain-containing protein [Xylaria sp. FL0064]
MRSYEYLPLQSESDIRLVTILPGKFDDPIRAKITHESLVPPKGIESTHMSVEEIARTLPEQWEAHETVEGRILFENIETTSTSWTHPDPNVDRVLYEQVPAGEIDLSVPSYEALSYAWGSPEKNDIIEIVVPRTTANTALSDSFLSRKLPITHNLELALRYIRFRDRPRTMWIDAVCIDQHNVQERNAQVQRMGQILSLAFGVVAWLGPDFVDSRLALTTLEEIGQQVEITKPTGLLLPSPQCSRPDWWCSLRRPIPLELNKLTAITKICEAPYLGRLWVLQELVLASVNSIVQCGHDAVSLPLFHHGILFLYGKFRMQSKELMFETHRALYSAANIMGAFLTRPLPGVLYRHHVRVCSDARDKVYACTNLLDLAVRKHIVVDYSKSPLDVYKQVFLVFLGQEKRLAQLPYAGHCTFPASAWPTWLPNWSERITIVSHRNVIASSISAARANYTAPNKLDVTGVSFAHMSTGSQALSGGLSSAVQFLKGLGLEDLQMSTYPNGATRLDAYLLTFCSGNVYDRFSDSYDVPTLSEVRDKVMELAVSPECTEQPTLVDGLVEYFMHRAGHVFTTHNGYIGRSDKPVQSGDEAFVILGCDSLMIVRPTPNGEYKVVGNCYIYGAMDGEALLGEVPYPWRVEIISNKRGTWTFGFQNDDLDEWREDDPRLDSIPLPAEWEPIEFEWTRSDPNICRKFRNRDTGEIINSDPRLYPEALLERGIPVKNITLI